MCIQRKIKKIKIGLSWIAAILWMLLIFKLSSEPASQSDGLSRGIVKIIIDTIWRIVPGMDFNMDIFNHILRKSAHFFSYFVLGVLVINANRKSGILGLKGFPLTVLICVLYASGDEIHQSFVPGRGPGITDVFIDSVGSIMGSGFYLMVANIFDKGKKVASINKNQGDG